MFRIDKGRWETNREIYKIPQRSFHSPSSWLCYNSLESLFSFLVYIFSPLFTVFFQFWRSTIRIHFFEFFFQHPINIIVLRIKSDWDIFYACVPLRGIRCSVTIVILIMGWRGREWKTTLECKWMILLRQHTPTTRTALKLSLSRGHDNEPTNSCSFRKWKEKMCQGKRRKKNTDGDEEKLLSPFTHLRGRLCKVGRAELINVWESKNIFNILRIGMKVSCKWDKNFYETYDHVQWWCQEVF